MKKPVNSCYHTSPPTLQHKKMHDNHLNRSSSSPLPPPLPSPPPPPLTSSMQPKRLLSDAQLLDASHQVPPWMRYTPPAPLITDLILTCLSLPHPPRWLWYTCIGAGYQLTYPLCPSVLISTLSHSPSVPLQPSQVWVTAVLTSRNCVCL